MTSADRDRARRRAADYRCRLRVPNCCNSYEDYLRTYNLDLEDLSPIRLEAEVILTLQVVARDPGAWVWRGGPPLYDGVPVPPEAEGPSYHITAEEWAKSASG